MNEGFADFWAGARSGSPQIGQYVGEWGDLGIGQGEGSLRDLENTFTCPSVLAGEVHQDSQHFSAAVWAARKQIAGTDAALQKQFDRAVLDALRHIVPLSTFEAAANAIADEVGTSMGATAKTQALKPMTDKGIIGCQRVVDLEPATPRTGYFLAPVDTTHANAPAAPGPVQFRVQPPMGATALKLTATGGVGQLGGLIGGTSSGPPMLHVLAKEGGRIVFTRTTTITADTTVGADFTRSGQRAVATVDIDGGCGGTEQYLALENTSDQGEWQLDTLAVEFTIDAAKAAACTAKPDGGSPDAGSVVADGGTGGGTGGTGGGSGGDTAKSGCGCGSAGALVVSVIGLLARRRRK
jgi:hypothetical protein